MINKGGGSIINIASVSSSTKGIPKNSDRFYKRTKEWVSWEDYLGKDFRKGVKAI